MSPVLDVSALGRQLLAPGAVAFSAGGFRLLALGVVVVLAARILAWRRRTYVLDRSVLRVEGGVVVRSQQLVPCERIQQVNLVQKLRHRMLGVAILEVQTAVGGPGAELRLEVLAFHEAERLRSALLAAKARVTEGRTAAGTGAGAVGPGGDERGDGDDRGDGVVGEIGVTGDGGLAGVGDVGVGDGGAGVRRAEEAEPTDEGPQAPPWVPAAWPVLELGYRQLAVAGLTGMELLVVLAIVPATAQLASELPWRPWDDVQLPAFDVLGPTLLVALALGFVVVWLAGAAAVSILANAGYRLDLVGDELHLSRGLLNHNETTLPLARVQAVRVSASLPRRALGLVSLRIQSAGTGANTEDTRLAVPILPVSDLDRVLALVLPGAGPLPDLHRPPRAALRRAVVRHAAPVSVVAVVVSVVVWPWGVLALPTVPAAFGLGVAAYRGLGHALADGFLVARSGSCNRKTVVVPVARSQSARVQAGVWQRRAGLASLLVDLAGPGPRPLVQDEAAPIAEDLMDQVMAGVGGVGGDRRVGAVGAVGAVGTVAGSEGHGAGRDAPPDRGAATTAG
jgi:putative membrane protein